MQTWVIEMAIKIWSDIFCCRTVVLQQYLNVKENSSFYYRYVKVVHWWIEEKQAS